MFLKKGLWILLAVLLLFVCGTALADSGITFSPENPRMGDYVDIVVHPGREGVQSVSYRLETPAGTVFDGSAKSKDHPKPETHLSVSFRPREEAVYTLTVTLVYGKRDEETVSVTIPVSGQAPEQEGPDVVYSQKDGWWAGKIYSKANNRDVQKAGCALFALSHALQRMGYTGEALKPDQLAKAYSRRYIAGRGTDNEGFLNDASADFGFQTHEDLIESEEELRTWFRKGCYFSFMIVNGHIAMADGLSEDGTRVHVVDSAFGATWERMKKGTIYIRGDDGTFTEVTSPDQVPGLRYFFETREYGGLAYWLDLSYCARQGMRPIRKPWMTMDVDGQAVAVEPEYAGALMSRVTLGEEQLRVPTRDLSWSTTGSGEPLLAVVTKKSGVSFLDGNGKAKEGIRAKLSWGTLLPVLEVGEDSYYVFYKGKFGYISRKGAETLPVSRDRFETALVSLNGRTAGTSPVNIRMSASAKGKIVGTGWKPGTPIALVRKEGEFWLAEGKGLRAWIHEKYVTLEGEDPNGQTVNEGE